MKKKKAWKIPNFHRIKFYRRKQKLLSLTARQKLVWEVQKTS